MGRGRGRGGYLGAELGKEWLSDRSTMERVSKHRGNRMRERRRRYFEHMEKGGFASIVEAEEEELRMFVEEAK